MITFNLYYHYILPIEYIVKFLFVYTCFPDPKLHILADVSFNKGVK